MEKAKSLLSQAREKIPIQKLISKTTLKRTKSLSLKRKKTENEPRTILEKYQAKVIAALRKENKALKGKLKSYEYGRNVSQIEENRSLKKYEEIKIKGSEATNRNKSESKLQTGDVRSGISKRTVRRQMKKMNN